MKTWSIIGGLLLAAFSGRADVTLKDFHLDGDLKGDRADFNLTAKASVDDAQGGSIVILSGATALTSLDLPRGEKIHIDGDKFVLTFDRRGEFPIDLKFSAAVTQSNEWNAVNFHVAPSVLQPVALRGLPADTKIEFAGAARPERQGDEFVSFLPSDGAVSFSWKEVQPESEGKLFFSSEMLAQITVRPGLMRQADLLNFKVMQGELNRVTLLLRGDGEVTRVQGDQVLSWKIEPATNSSDRRLVVELNQPQKDQFSLQAVIETPLGAFPQEADACWLRPEDATRFAGYFRVVNEGAVRLAIRQTGGMSQISPEQFPESDATRAAFHISGSQLFAYRFASGDVSLHIDADQIEPEVSASHLLTYHDGESELDIDDEIELDIREAPLRELTLRTPKGYVVAKLNMAELRDYNLSEPPGEDTAELRLIFGKPLSGRQVLELRLEDNHGLDGAQWDLPRVDVVKAKSARGQIGVTAEAGFRLTVDNTRALTEMAAAFFPGKPAGLQAAFRLSDADWAATMRVERLPQTVQVEAMHLFSIGEGIAYGSSVLNYTISGAPTATFKVALSDEYTNIEFAGKDIRSWQKTDGGYVVQLHTPVSGAYTMLATYERPFQSHGETLTFTGAQPLDARSEQGHIIVISAYQFKVNPTEVSSGLLALEPAEVPSQYRLYFDAPILSAYRYAARPFNLKLALSPLAQRDSVNQIVDRASLDTRISKEGQVVTTARYFIKNRGQPNLRLTIPAGADLWSVLVNNAAVVPVQDGNDRLIPLPRQADPNAALELDLTVASRSEAAEKVAVATPILNAPIMWGEWKLSPDAGRKLHFEKGSLPPETGDADESGFAQVARLFSGPRAATSWVLAIAALVLSILAVLAWRRKGMAPAAVGAALALFFVLLKLAFHANAEVISVPGQIVLLAPVQQAGAGLAVTVSTLAETTSIWDRVIPAWPALLTLPFWFLAAVTHRRDLRAAGWFCLAWAALSLTNGGEVFVIVLGAFLLWEALAPGWRRVRLVKRPSEHGLPGAATALIVGGLLLAWNTQAAPAPSAPPVPDFVNQTVRVEGKVVFGEAKLRWRALKGQKLSLLNYPAVLTRATYPERDLKLEPGINGSTVARQLLALKDGTFEIDVAYQTVIENESNEDGFSPPTPFGIVNNAQVTVAGLDVVVHSTQAVEVRNDNAGTNTAASLILRPGGARISWGPRSRDIKNEKPVFYAELLHALAPAAGMVENATTVTIRPAQGELDELNFTVPHGATITDVTAPMISLWRFDPDTRKLRIRLNPAQAKPFAVVVRAQMASGALPFEMETGLLQVDNAAGQIGLVGVATGNEVQLDSAGGKTLSAINLEDFPEDGLAALQAQIPGLAVRRAFRYGDPAATLALKASAVEPDVRVEAQQTLSLGEDRCVLAANLSIEIARAGIFDLSFVAPDGYDIESISGAALSQWTESKTASGRLITMHLTGKTIGSQTFAISLAGPGVKTARNWVVPQIAVHEAAKQRGTLLLVPEQGMRLQVEHREGLTQIDPQKAGINDKGALLFEQLQAPCALNVDVEQVEAWVQVTGLEHAAVTEAAVKVTANLQYQIENAGVKSFRVLVPAGAEGVQFRGDQVGDFQVENNSTTNGVQSWLVSLHRRVIGSYMLQLLYEMPLASGASTAVVSGVQAEDINLQRGFFTVQSDPRLQLTVDQTPEALQPTEWQSIPAALQKDLQSASADFAYRLVEASFQLPLKLQRHEAAKILPAHIVGVSFHTVVADDGGALTQARLQILPGDKRLLAFTLPEGAQFWFAFVNDRAVWPWREGDDTLIPLERFADPKQAATVEIFYNARAGAASSRALDLQLLAPKFELPLENITWRVSMGEKWRVTNWKGSLQLESNVATPPVAIADTQTYLQSESESQSERMKEAETLVASGNSFLSNSDSQQARRAFEAAYGLSAHDPAFNEDARVQLHNVKVQQALMALNIGNSMAAGDVGDLGAKLRDLRTRKDSQYSQQDAKDVMDSNSADDNAAFVRLADKMIQQQEAWTATPAALRASIPEEGRSLTFKRAVAVDHWADLRIDLTAKMNQAATSNTRLLILAATAALLAIGFGFRPQERGTVAGDGFEPSKA